MPRRPILIFIIVFALLLALTQFLAYQQYKIVMETKQAGLIHEAVEAKDRFRNILFNDIAAANTLAIIYKQYGVPAKFDSVAHQIIQNSRYAEALQITENGIVRNVYPDIRYKATIGTNVNADPMRKAEETRAIERKDIYFAGPRRLRFGDTGILGKVPVIIDNKVVAVTTVLTRLPAIKKALVPLGADKNKFVYQLLKTNGKSTNFFLLSDAKPKINNEYVDLHIPEGDWLLRISYGNGYTGNKFPFELSGLGLLFSFIAALLAFRKAQEPYKLNKIIDEKTEQLTKSERYFRTLIETSSDAIVLLDIDGQVLYQSPSTEKILGYTLEEVQQMDGLQLIHPDDRKEDNSTFYKEISEHDAIVQRSHRIKHKNGNYIYVEGTYRNLLHDNNIKAIVYSYKDVTEKVLFEQTLIESENRFRRAFEDSAIGMGLTSIEESSMGQWLKVNRSLYEMLGYTEDELLSLTFMQITHPDDLDRDLAAQDKILRGESDTYRLEKRYIHKDGSYVWINLNVSIIRDKDKKPIYLVAQVENITDRKEMYDEIIRSGANLRSIFNTTNVSYLLLDTSYNIIALNQQMKEIYINVAGISLNEGDNLIELLLPEKRETAKKTYDKVVQTNQSEDYETAYEKDGSFKYFMANVKPIHDGQRVIGICISAVDITEQKKLTLDLLSHVKAIEERNKKLQEIAWLQSHGVRAPLARMMGLIDLLNNHENNDMDERTILNYIVLSANELDQLIQDITDKVYLSDNPYD